MVRLVLVLCAVFASSILIAGDKANLVNISRMRTMYKDVVARSVIVHEAVSDRIAAAKTNDVCSAKIKEFINAENHVRTLETPPLAVCSEDGPSRVWQARKRLDGYEPRSSADNNYTSGPEAEVILFNRELVHEATDLTMPGRGGLAFVFGRTYFSNLSYDGPVGNGWDFSYNVRLVFTDENSAALYQNGRVKRFYKIGEIWESEPGNFSRLEYDGKTCRIYSGVLTRMEFERSVECDSAWRLKSIATRHDNYAANRMEFSYEPSSDRLSEISDPMERKVWLSYDKSGRIIQVRSEVDSVQYGYDASGNLISVKGLPILRSLSETCIHETIYGYSSVGHRSVLTSRRLSGENRTYTVDYGSDCKVISSGYSEPNGLDARWCYSENTDGTIVKPAEPSPEIRYHYVSSGCVQDLPEFKILPAMGATNEFKYSKSGLTVWVRDADGVERQFQYDDANKNPCSRENLLSLSILPLTLSGLTSGARIDHYTSYGKDTSFPIEEHVTETSENGKTKELWSTQYSYSADWEITEENENGLKTRICYNRYGNAVVQFNGVGSAVISRYADKDAGCNYAFESGEVNGNGFLCSVIEDASDDQIEQAFTALGEKWYGRTSLRVHPVARETFYAYDKYGNQVAIKQNGRVSLALANRDGDILAEYSPKKGVQITEYSQSGLKMRVMREIGSAVNRYDNALTNLYFNGRFVSDSLERDALGRVVSVVRNSSGFTGEQERYSYCRFSNGMLNSIINPLGITREDKYNPATGLLAEQRLVGGTLSQTLRTGFVYNASGNVLEFIDHLGEKTRVGYDGFGRRESILTADGVTHKTVTDGMERTVVECALTNGVEISHKDYEYGPNGMLSMVSAVKTDDKSKKKVTFSKYVYDNAGQLIAERGAKERDWTYHLIDGLGRIVASMLPNGEFKFVVFEGNDPFVSASWPCSSGMLDEQGITEGCVTICDAEGNVVNTIPVDASWNPVFTLETVSKYDCTGNRTDSVSAGQCAVSFQYDTFGKTLSERTSPLSHKYGEEERLTVYEYLPDGQLKRKTVANNALLVRNIGGTIEPSRVTAPQIFEYEYDELGRSVRFCQPDGLTVTRKYDNRSMPVEMTWSHIGNLSSPLRKIGLEFGALGRLVKISDNLGNKDLQTFEYDTYGNRVRLEDMSGPASVVICREYDSLGAMTSEEVVCGKYKFPVRYDMDWEKGKKIIDLNSALAQPWVRGVAGSNWHTQEETVDSRGLVTEVRLGWRNDALKSSPFATWKYRCGMPVERYIPSSCLKTEYSYDNNGLLVNAGIFQKNQCFGKMSYTYDDKSCLASELISLNENIGSEYQSSQYFDYSAYRQLVAQNTESCLEQEDLVNKRRTVVLDGESGSLQASKTSRMSYDQVENLWLEYIGKAAGTIQPGQFDSSSRAKMYSSANVIDGHRDLTQIEMHDLASNRETTMVSFSGKSLKAEMNEYDRLGCLKRFDGEYWNGAREFPVTWNLDYDALGRLSHMRGTLREAFFELKKGDIVAEIEYLYDSSNRRIKKNVSGKTGSIRENRVEWTVYNGNNQILLFEEDGENLNLKEQYLWNGESRELVMASLPEGEAENIASARSVRYYFQQDRGFNTVCITKAEGGAATLVSGASYLGFGKNTTSARVVNISTSMSKLGSSEASYNRSLDDGKVASWKDGNDWQYLELELSGTVNLTELAVWTDEAFPKDFSVYVLPPDANSPSISGFSAWLYQARLFGYYLEDRHVGKIDSGHSVDIPLYGIRGNRIVIIWRGDKNRIVNVREFEVLRKPDNPGSIAYAGQWLDRETGLYYQINRYRIAGSNKFISPDPLGFFDGPNMYAYAHANPLEWHDPDGRWAHILMGAGIGAALNGGVYALQCWITGQDFSWKEFGIQVAIGAVAGGVSAATFGMVNPMIQNAAWIVKIAGSATPLAADIGGGVASGFVSGTFSGGLSTLAHGGDIASAMKTGLSSGAWGALGGGIGGGITSALGWGWGSAMAGGAAAGGVVGGGRSFLNSVENGDDFGQALKNTWNGAWKGAAFGAATGLAAQAVNKVTSFGIKVSQTGRPSFRRGARDQAWGENTDAHGHVRDPVSGRYMGRNRPWDMGHKPGYEYRKQLEFANNNHWTQGTLSRDYNDSAHYRPELPSSNRSHSGELMTDVYFGANY